MKIIQIISQNKRLKLKRYQQGEGGYICPSLMSGYKRVEAIVERDGIKKTEHIDILI